MAPKFTQYFFLLLGYLLMKTFGFKVALLLELPPTLHKTKTMVWLVVYFIKN